MRDDSGARGGDGLFEVEPVEQKQSQGRPAAVDKRFGAFDPHEVLLLPPSLDDWLLQDHLARSSPTLGRGAAETSRARSGTRSRIHPGTAKVR